MTTRNGFQKTEIGRIPSEWDVGTVDEYCTVVDCRHVTAEFVMSGTPVASIGEVQSRYVNLSSAKQTTDEFYQHLIGGGRKPQAGDLIFSRNATVGEVAQVTESHPPFAMGQDVCLIRKKGKEHSSDYLQSVIRSNIVTNQLENMMVGSTFRRVNVRQIKSLIVPVPKPKEQRAIAEALSDVDALINALDALITKKRHIKQGTMQQLLTGKKRLPGFSGEWEEKSVFDLAECKKERFDDGDWIESEFITDSGVRLIQTGNIGEGFFKQKEKKKYISEESFNLLRCKEIVPGDLLVCRLADPAGRACVLPDIGERKVITSVDVTIFRPSEVEANPVFLSNCFTTNSWYDEVNERCGGTTRTRISRSALGGITLVLPPVKEQTAIAEVLSDMDAEITALEQKRDKTKLIKQGMMQELLTGKTRLI